MRPIRSSLAILLLTCAASLAHAAPPRFAAPFLYYGTGLDDRVVALGDVNADGHPDVFALTQSGLEVRLGVGDGTLGPAIVTPLLSRLILVTGDLDGDGATDVVTEADSLHLAVRLGNGDGTFAASTLYAALKAPADAVLTDLDGDSDLDLVCTATRSNAVSVFMGDGAGGFGPRADIPVGPSPLAIAAGDLDHDGDADIVVAHTAAPWGFTRLLGDGAGGLTFGGSTTLSQLPWDLALADLDGDTWLDAVTNVITTPAFLTVPGGPGGFGAPTSHLLSAVSRGVVVADVDGDTRPDVVTFGYLSNHGDVFRGAPGFTFAPAQPFSVPRWALAVAAGDLNGGGKMDLVSLGGGLAVHMGNGDGTFGGVSDVADGAETWSVACADLDADGHADLVSTQASDATVRVRFGGPAGAWSAPVVLATALQPHGVTIADIDADGHLDVLVAANGPGTQSESSIAVFRGDGARGFGPRQPTTVGRWSQAVAVGDLDGDAFPDVAVAQNDFTASLTVLHGAGGGAFGAPQFMPLGSNASDVAIADVTRDGRADILLASYYTNELFVVPRLPGGGLGSPISFAVTSPVAVAVGDVAGDASPDLLVSGLAGVSVFESTPGGGFSAKVDHPGGNGALAIADLDLDGRLDIAAANAWNSNTLSVWFGSANGLGDATAYGAGDRPVDVAAADVDGDGLPDLVSANMESSSLSLLLNTGGVAWLPWLGVPPPVATTALTLRARPNPLLASGVVEYGLPRAQHVTLRLLDVAGRELARLEDGDRAAGPHSVPLRTNGLRAGVAFLDLRAGTDRVVQRVIVLR